MSVALCRWKFLSLLSVALLGVSVMSVARADVTSCFNFLNAQDYARAETEARQLLNRSNIDRAEQRIIYLCLGRAYLSTGRAQDALPVFQKMENLSQSTKELAGVYKWLGAVYRDLSDLDRAELYFERTLKAFRELGDKSGEAFALNSLGLVAHERHDTNRALALYKESISIEPDQAKKADQLSNIAVIYAERKDYKSATKLFQQAIEIARRSGDTHQAAIYQINFGTLLSSVKQYSAGEKELLAGLNAMHLVGDKRWEAEACVNLATLIMNRNAKRASEAVQWFEKAEVLYREIGDTATADALANALAEK